jgi:hypothetical protein
MLEENKLRNESQKQLGETFCYIVSEASTS